MTPEEKKLLLRELCDRLPYGITIYRITDDSTHRIQYSDITENIDQFAHFLECSGIENIKPYLRPLVSMTDEEKKELFEAIDKDMHLLEETLDKEPIFTYHNSRYICNPIHYELDFLISHHFDCRDLIPMGLALEATEGMYN